MKNNIINSILALLFCVGLYFIVVEHFKINQYKKLKNEYALKYINLQLDISKNLNAYMDSYIVDSRDFNEPYSFTLLKKIHKRDRHNIETAKTLYALDSIVLNDPLGKNWARNKNKIRFIFFKVTNADDSLKLKGNIHHSIPYDLNEIFEKDKLTFFEWSLLLELSIHYKDILKSRMSGFCICFSSYQIMYIPSKQIVKAGDTISIDLVNYIGQDFIPQTYNFTSNYDKFLILESGYNGCRYCGEQANYFLVQEYQIPFSEIKKDEKWRSVFYFRNDKLEQDSVVLERELDF
ncbi:hypothetical protein [Bernardetia sp.]|uniref:hypothetical protein n=1 Tax=Bernardetia sp. TaxID=1937974 RepID=UPI0025BAF25C|nr:hypothetical protein [Bernardetia sp.]